MESFNVNLADGSQYVAEPFVNPENGKTIYIVVVDNQSVVFGGNPSIGRLIIPYNPPQHLEQFLLDDITDGIEHHFM